MGIFQKEIIPAIILAMTILPIGFVLAYPAFQYQYSNVLGFPDKDKDKNTRGLSTSFPAIFAIFGSPIINVVNKFFGRKISAAVVTGFYMLGWLFLCFPTKKSLLPVYFIGRAIGGLGVGASCAVIPPYITEITSPENRGPYGTFSQLFVSFGFAIVYAASCNVAAVNMEFKDQEFDNSRFTFTYIHCSIMCLLFSAVVLVLLFLFVPNPPTEAIPELDAEEKVKDSLFQRKYALPFIAGLLPLVFQQFSGINTFLTNLNRIFESAKIEVNSGGASIAVTLSQSVTTIITIPFLKYLGRKWAWCVSAGGQAIFLILSAINELKIGNTSVLPVLCLFFYCFFYGLGLGPLPFAVMSEIIPDSVRSTAVGIAQVINWFLAWATVFAIDAIGGKDGYYYLFFGICNVLGFLYGLTLLPNDVVQKEDADI